MSSTVENTFYWAGCVIFRFMDSRGMEKVSTNELTRGIGPRLCTRMWVAINIGTFWRYIPPCPRAPNYFPFLYRVVAFKVILLGDSAVGKSKLVERYLMDEYNPRQLSTFALTLFRKNARLDDGAEVKVGATSLSLFFGLERVRLPYFNTEYLRTKGSLNGWQHTTDGYGETIVR